MTQEEKDILRRINAYADSKDNHMDPSKIRDGKQLEKLMPIMRKIALEKNMKVEDVFVLYMDLSSSLSAEQEKRNNEVLGNL